MINEGNDQNEIGVYRNEVKRQPLTVFLFCNLKDLFLADAATDSEKQKNANRPNTGGLTSNGTASFDTETHNHSPSLNRCKSRESIV